MLHIIHYLRHVSGIGLSSVQIKFSEESGDVLPANHERFTSKCIQWPGHVILWRFGNSKVLEYVNWVKYMGGGHLENVVERMMLT
jgi:hypothetical protein